MERKIGSHQEEGQTPIEDTSGLIPDIKFQNELDVHEYRNYTKAITKYRLMSINDKTAPFTYEWLRGVHRDMLDQVWEWAGQPREVDTNMGVPKEKIGSEIHKLLYELKQWEEQNKPPAEIAVRLHHRLVWIHPFKNGNGRWARLIINLYLRKKELKPIQWPSNPEFVKKTFRPTYIKAMKEADHGDISLLAEIHQKNSKG